MITGGVNRRNLVRASREAFVDGGSKDTVFGFVVQAFEEREDIGIGGLRGVDRVDLLNNNVRVTSDLTSIIELLWGSEIVLLGICEKSSFHALDSHFNSESLVLLNVLQVLGEDEFR